mmetsp:Transcript_11755/g.47308  ORF Transcript_11755/g.47308 Transcript_11755/m.47308 type:complete len:213 (+) Transcript_11755:139-777(+)
MHRHDIPEAWKRRQPRPETPRPPRCRRGRSPRVASRVHGQRRPHRVGGDGRQALHRIPRQGYQHRRRRRGGTRRRLPVAPGGDGERRHDAHRRRRDISECHPRPLARADIRQRLHDGASNRLRLLRRAAGGLPSTLTTPESVLVNVGSHVVEERVPIGAQVQRLHALHERLRVGVLHPNLQHARQLGPRVGRHSACYEVSAAHLRAPAQQLE